MDKLLRIGQVSNLYGISLDALRYYDHKGLLNPMVDKQNGYRYYSLEQLDTLEMILVGKHLEIPLAQMKETIHSESIDSYLDMMQEQLQFIEAKKDALTKLFQYTTKMTNMLKNIEDHVNDRTFSTVTADNHMDVTIFKVNLKDFFNTRTSPMINAVEDLEQWLFYQVNEDGSITEDTKAMGLSFHSGITHTNELQKYLDEAMEQGKISDYFLSGSYRHINFWGNEADLKEYLYLLCTHFKLKDTTLTINFRFALLHKDLKHEYWTDIYF